MRFLALGGVIAPVWLATVAALCASLRPGYDHLTQFVSELGATGTPHAALMNYGGFLPTGACLVALGIAMRAGLPRSRATRSAAVLVLLFGTGVFASGLARCDPGCPQRGASPEGLLHEILGPAAFLCAMVGAALLGWGLAQRDDWRGVQRTSLVASALALCFFIGLGTSVETRAWTGLWQRALVGTLFLWTAVVGTRLFRDPDTAAS
ncbi:MAG: DUF998 domain-containing protein [Myxococcota bacterium]